MIAPAAVFLKMSAPATAPAVAPIPVPFCVLFKLLQDAVIMAIHAIAMHIFFISFIFYLQRETSSKSILISFTDFAFAFAISPQRICLSEAEIFEANCLASLVLYFFSYDFTYV